MSSSPPTKTASPAGSLPPPEAAWYGIDPRQPNPGADPHPAMRQLREAAPVNRTPGGFWRLSRYEDCARLLREVRCGVRHRDGSAPRRREDVLAGGGQFMLEQDPPTHTRLRKLVSKAFTPRAAEQWRGRAQEIVNHRLDAILAADEFDLVNDLALPVPATLICEMLGVPNEDQASFTRWTADATHALAGSLAAPAVIERAQSAGAALAGYFQELIESRRRERRYDLLGHLIEAEEAGDRLRPEELLVQSIGLLIAGFETTIGLIANGCMALLRYPAELAKLRERPERIAGAVEECLRFDGPIGATVRILHEDVRFGDHELPADTEVWAMLWSANRDPAQFTAPDRLDIERPNAREHLSFGGGVHLCLGAHLARMEAQVAIGSWAARTRGRQIDFDPQAVEWGRSLFRVPARVPLRIR